MHLASQLKELAQHVKKILRNQIKFDLKIKLQER